MSFAQRMGLPFSSSNPGPPFPLQEVSDWISLASPSHLDYGTVAEVSLYVAGGSCEVSHSSIHPSAWNMNSAKFGR
jgi:hypothetical protein